MYMQEFSHISYDNYGDKNAAKWWEVFKRAAGNMGSNAAGRRNRCCKQGSSNATAHTNPNQTPSKHVDTRS